MSEGRVALAVGKAGVAIWYSAAWALMAQPQTIVRTIQFSGLIFMADLCQCR
jgi:hypothetical protein